MSSKFPVRRYKKGEFIVKQSKKFSGVCLLKEGEVEVVYETRLGHERIIATQSAPMLIGHLEAWSEQRSLASVRARKPSAAALITRPDFFKLLQSSHQLCINLIRITSLMYCEAGHDRRLDIFGQIENLLANMICTLAVTGDKDINVELPNKTHLAKVLGVSRKSIIRAMKNLEAEGLIKSVNSSKIWVSDLKKLRERSFDI